MDMFVDMLIYHVHSHEMFHKTKQAAILTTYMLPMNIVWTQLEFQDIQEHQSVQYIVVNVMKFRIAILIFVKFGCPGLHGLSVLAVKDNSVAWGNNHVHDNVLD
jgi:uncharacterized protein YybS (DUF2232 family)